MTNEQIQKWMKQPHLLDKESLMQLEFLVHRFPMFQPVRFLYLKNLKQIDTGEYEKQLPLHTLYITNRTALHNFLAEAATEEPVVAVVEQPKVEAPIAIPLIKSDEISKNTLAAFDYASYFLADDEDEIEAEQQDTAKLKHQDLVDRYLNQPVKEKVFKTVEEEPADQVAATPPENNRMSEQEPPTLLSESLAKIYIKQKKYGKALHIIKGLSLKYPEKSVYFADQIRFLELVVNNIKQ